MRPHLSRAQCITSYVTMQLQCIAAFGGLQAKLQQMKVVLCCLDGENVVGSRTYKATFSIPHPTTCTSTLHFYVSHVYCAAGSRVYFAGGHMNCYIL